VKVFVLQRECGDYYCDGHIVGVFLDEEDASRAGGGGDINQAEKVTPIEVGEARWRDRPWEADDGKRAWT
jgi:hypothetical protein